MKQILILGSHGLLGTAVKRCFEKEGYAVTAADIDTLDVTREADVTAFIEKLRPDIVINCAAYTDVDRAETEQEKAFAVNAEAVRYIAGACKKIGAKLVHYSTDYVFDGTKEKPYIETDQTSPLSAYARSKVKGEDLLIGSGVDHLLIRSAWLFGAGENHFVAKIIAAVKRGQQLRVVDDQIGSPTYVPDLVTATRILIEKNATGIFHVTNTGYVSWYNYAKKVVEAIGCHVPVQAIKTQALSLAARRPLNSRLDCSKFARFVGAPLPGWSDGVGRYLADRG